MTRYFVTGDCSCAEPTEHEVSKADYVHAERKAGFHNTMGQPLEPATHSFGSSNPPISGRTEDEGVDLADLRQS